MGSGWCCWCCCCCVVRLVFVVSFFFRLWILRSDFFFSSPPTDQSFFWATCVCVCGLWSWLVGATLEEKAKEKRKKNKAVTKEILSKIVSDDWSRVRDPISARSKGHWRFENQDTARTNPNWRKTTKIRPQRQEADSDSPMAIQNVAQTRPKTGWMDRHEKPGSVDPTKPNEKTSRKRKPSRAARRRQHQIHDRPADFSWRWLSMVLILCL